MRESHPVPRVTGTNRLQLAVDGHQGRFSLRRQRANWLRLYSIFLFLSHSLTLPCVSASPKQMRICLRIWTCSKEEANSSKDLNDVHPRFSGSPSPAVHPFFTCPSPWSSQVLKRAEPWGTSPWCCLAGQCLGRNWSSSGKGDPINWREIVWRKVGRFGKSERAETRREVGSHVFAIQDHQRN